MPNGLSCAYFAVRNHETGKKENNVFREGIADIQGIRTMNAAAGAATSGTFVSFASSIKKACHINKDLGIIRSIGKIATPLQKPLSMLSSVGKKFVYPLIIASEILNTVRSDDKKKKACCSATAIGTMYILESLIENSFKRLKVPEKWDLPFQIFKGTTFICASLAGYDIGNNISGNIVDKIRAKKSCGNIQNTESTGNGGNIEKQDETTHPGFNKNNLFEDIRL